MSYKRLYTWGSTLPIKSFSQDRSGAVAIIFVILALPLMGVIALGLEYSKSKTYHEKLQSIADSATLAAIRGNPSKTIQQRQEATINALKSGISLLDTGNTITVTQLSITPSDQDIVASVTLQSPYKMSFGAMFNMDKSIIKASSTRKTNRAIEAQIRHDCHIGSPETLQKYDCSSLP